MQILLPIAGHSQFFPESEFYFPKPLLEIDGKPMIERVISNLDSFFPGARYTFVIHQTEARKYSLTSLLNLLVPNNPNIIERQETSGALCSCLLAYDKLDPELPLLISNSDQIIDASLDEAITFFGSQNADCGLLTFESVHPRWSYVISGEQNNVDQAYEKKVVSKNAICGLYYYKKAKYFLQSASAAIIKSSTVNGSYFLSAAINEMILAGRTVKFRPIPSEAYHSFYSPAKIKEYENHIFTSQTVQHLNTQDQSDPTISVVIPAAGHGSRFANSGWLKPKPFIDVNGSPMVQHVASNIALNSSTYHVILKAEHIDFISLIDESALPAPVKHHFLQETTEGTLCTVMSIHEHLNNHNPVLIANSDQLVEFDLNILVQDCLSRNLDGSILVFREPSLDPKWSYVELDKNGFVTRLEEKQAISDLATVGIYFFREGRQLVDAALDMFVANDRTNNEFYTGPVYNYLIRAGLKIGIIEIDRSAMHGLGTPEDLNSYLTTHALPPSADSPKC